MQSQKLGRRNSRDESDEWDARALGVPIPAYDGTSRLCFRAIEQPWLKKASKEFIRHAAATKSYSSLKVYLVTLRHFSGFLSRHKPQSSPKTLSRELLTQYFLYLNKKRLSSTTRQQRLLLLRSFFEVGNVNGWLRTPPHLIRTEDIPQFSKPAPRFIPEEVLEQLNRHLDSLPSPIARMVLVIQECGLRIGELVQLPRYCIEQDSRGDWHLRHFDFKMKKDRVKPISTEIAEVIREQQDFLGKHLSTDFPYLFSANERGGNGLQRNGRPGFSPKSHAMYAKGFQRYLQKVVDEHDIRDSSGRLWHFQSHQFRHTVGARMINSGVPPHIIQRYLGHESPEMTMRYAHIHDETLKRELAQYLGRRLVDINGNAVRAESAVLNNEIDREWMKQNVLAQALPNGSCSRPLLKGACPHANACLTCCDFRTSEKFLDQHKEHVRQTEEIIAEAEKLGWRRQAEMNRQVQSNLLKIIRSLEGAND